jgi:hypothetical protein
MALRHGRLQRVVTRRGVYKALVTLNGVRKKRGLATFVQLLSCSESRSPKAAKSDTCRIWFNADGEATNGAQE